MSRVVSEERWEEMLVKSHRYEAGIAPLEAKYELRVNILLGINFGLIVAIIVLIYLYTKEKAVTRYLKKCLNLNFGWFKK